MVIKYLKDDKIFYQNYLREEAVYQNDSNVSLIHRLAQYYFVDYESTRRLIAKQFDFVQKTPIMLVHNFCLMFPTLSAHHQECIWLNYYAIDRIKDLGNHQVGIYFTKKIDHFHLSKVENDEYLIVNVDVRGIRAQLKRCQLLHDTYLHHRHVLNIK